MRSSAAVILALVFCTPTAGAQAERSAATPSLVLQQQGTYVVPGSHTFAVRSSRGRAYRIFVWVPNEAAPVGGFPALVTLDANAYFAATVGALQVMAPSNPLLKMKLSPVRPMIVIGVGYPGDEPFAVGERAYDFLPALTAGDTQLPRQGWPGHPPGGADHFIDFLVYELRPALAARFPIDPERQSLMGHSLGGFFTLYALMKRPAAFRNYIAVSPSLWWDEHKLVNEAAGATGFARAAPSQRGVLVAVARDELPESPDRSRLMRKLGRTMVAHLSHAGAKHLDARYLELPVEDHQSMQIATLPAALRQASK